MNAFFLVVDEGLADIASAHSLHIAETWNCDAHIFLERRDPLTSVREIKNSRIFYHYEELSGMLPPNLPGDAKWPNIVYLRLFAPSVLIRYDRLIYIDADILSLRVDQGVWNVPLPAGIGAVSDLATLHKAPHDLKSVSREDWLRSIGVKSDSYANSGFLLIDPKSFSKHDFARALPEYFRRFPAAARYDQDFINSFFDGLWTEIGPRFNYQAYVLEFGFDEMIDPVFVHFCRKHKPWWGQNDNWFSPTDPKFTEAYDKILTESGFSEQDYRRDNHVKIERRIKYRVYRWLSGRGYDVHRKNKEMGRWFESSKKFINYFVEGVASGRFADERQRHLDVRQKQPHFDGRFVKTWWMK